MKLPADFSAEEQAAAMWIRGMAQGRTGALDELYHAYHRPLLRLFGAILKDDFEAEEVLQDTFVKAYRMAGRYDAALATPYAWLVTIGRRLAIDRLRRRAARPGMQPDSMEQPAPSADNGTGNGQQRADQQLEYAWIRDQFAALAPAQREAIELVLLDGHTHQEVALALGRPLGTVKSDLRRGLLQLRKLLLEGND
jgi:RNA polymerase sigma-70 factor (ECF subfamily)